MSASKDKDRGTWIVYIRYKDWKGESQVHKKRGFATKREALEYERQFLVKKSKDLNMPFPDFVDIYMSDIKPRIKYNTYRSKEYIIRDKILPYFKNFSVSSIAAPDIVQWQNELLQFRDSEGKSYTATYLRTIQNQLNAIMNYASKYYSLKENPVQKISKMGRAKAKEMSFWTEDEYLAFSEVMKSKPISYYAFEMLYWTGIREGELIALTVGDFNLKKRTLKISKSLQRIKGEDVVTDPKTEKSNRVIDLPQFLCDEMEDYMGMLYKADKSSRLFTISKSYLHHEMDRGCKTSGVKRIRIHDLRHSHVAHLIELGFSPVEIAERLGHESMAVTMTYSHLYPSKGRTMADRLGEDRDAHQKGA